MRHKDEKKFDAICNAAISLINEIGFAQASMSKIAKRAEVSPASIYTYFENKEDMLVQLYIQGKRKMMMFIMQDYNPDLSIETSTKTIFKKVFQFAIEHNDFFAFTEQFSNSPLIHCVKEETQDLFIPLMEMVEKAKKDNIIRDLPMELITVFSFFPIMQLSKAHLIGEIKVDDKLLDTAVDLAWRAITV